MSHKRIITLRRSFVLSNMLNNFALSNALSNFARSNMLSGFALNFMFVGLCLGLGVAGLIALIGCNLEEAYAATHINTTGETSTLSVSGNVSIELVPTSTGTIGIGVTNVTVTTDANNGTMAPRPLLRVYVNNRHRQM